MLPNLIDGSFLKEQGDEKEVDQKMATKTETEKKTPKAKIDNKVSRRPNLPKLIIPEPPKNKPEVDDDDCSDCKDILNRKFKCNKVYLAHKGPNGEITKLVESDGSDQIYCVSPAVMICIN